MRAAATDLLEQLIKPSLSVTLIILFVSFSPSTLATVFIREALLIRPL
jgi:hypothetical protein